jgi:hypothetical protein
MKILLKIITSDGLIKLEGRILRSSISSLQGTPRYQSAIAFDNPFHMLDDTSAEAEERTQESPPEWANPSEPSSCPDEMLMPPIMQNGLEDDSAVLTVVTQDGMSLQEMLKLNDW